MDTRAWTVDELAAYRAAQERLARGETRHGKHRAGYTYTKFDHPVFVAWDGEGLTDADGAHRYVLLAAGWYDARGEWHERAIAADEGSRLKTTDCFEFLFKVGDEVGRRGVHVGFALTYDWTHILYDLDRAQAWNALVNNEQHFGWIGEYGVKVRQRHMLRVVSGKIKGKKRRSFTMWDVFGFFQASFVRAIENWLGADYPDLDRIRRGKAQRGGMIDDMRAYNRAELQALCRLMSTLHQSLQEADLKVKRWDGAGAIATAAFRAHMDRGWFDAARRAYAEREGLYTAVRHAYFGGRIELLKYGVYRGDIYHSDINSAYPAAMVGLPDLGRGEWRLIEGDIDLDDLPDFSLVAVTWDFGDKLITPFPLRTHAGKIIYAHRGSGWFWLPEVRAVWRAMQANGRRAERVDWSRGCTLDVEGAWVFVPESEARPFAWIADLYERRRELKEGGKHGAEKVIKLAINSLYGKMAQQVGYHDFIEEIENPFDGRKRIVRREQRSLPPFFNLGAAGYITARTRAAIIEAVMRDPASVIAIATDGIYSTRPLVEHAPVKELGKWSVKKYENALGIFVQPGVYFIRDGERWYEYCRGFPRAGGLSEVERQADIQARVGRIIDAWRTRVEHIRIDGQRFVTLRSALHSDYDQRGNFVDIIEDGQYGRKLVVYDGTAARRALKHEFWRDSRAQTPDRVLIETVPRAVMSEYSYPYRSIPLAESKVESEEDFLEAWQIALDGH